MASSATTTPHTVLSGEGSHGQVHEQSFDRRHDGSRRWFWRLVARSRGTVQQGRQPADPPGAAGKIHEPAPSRAEHEPGGEDLGCSAAQIGATWWWQQAAAADQSLGIPEFHRVFRTQPRDPLRAQYTGGQQHQPVRRTLIRQTPARPVATRAAFSCMPPARRTIAAPVRSRASA